MEVTQCCQVININCVFQQSGHKRLGQELPEYTYIFMLIALPDYTITIADCSIRVLYFSKWKSGYGLVCWLGGKLPLEIPGGKGLLARPWVLLFSQPNLETRLVGIQQITALLDTNVFLTVGVDHIDD